jgi:hypothetical protein
LRARPHGISLPLSVAFAALLAGVAAACSLTTSLDGFSNGAAVGDGGPALVEGGTIGDGGGQPTDAGDGGFDAGPAFRCADHPQATYCADFETTPVTLGWKHVTMVAGGTLNAVPGRFGVGLAAAVPPYDSPAEPIASLESDLQLNDRQDFTYAVDMLADSLSGGGQVDFVAFGFHGPFYILTLRAGGGGHVDLYEYGDSFGATAKLDHYLPLLVQPTLGRWVHVEGQVTFTASTIHLKLTFDGVLAFDGNLQGNPWVGQPYVYTGITQASGGGSNPITIRVDDLLVTTP